MTILTCIKLIRRDPPLPQKVIFNPLGGTLHIAFNTSRVRMVECSCEGTSTISFVAWLNAEAGRKSLKVSGSSGVSRAQERLNAAKLYRYASYPQYPHSPAHPHLMDLSLGPSEF